MSRGVYAPRDCRGNYFSLKSKPWHVTQKYKASWRRARNIKVIKEKIHDRNLKWKQKGIHGMKSNRDFSDGVMDLFPVFGVEKFLSILTLNRVSGCMARKEPRNRPRKQIPFVTVARVRVVVPSRRSRFPRNSRPIFCHSFCPSESARRSWAAPPVAKFLWQRRNESAGPWPSSCWFPAASAAVRGRNQCQSRPRWSLRRSARAWKRKKLI